MEDFAPKIDPETEYRLTPEEKEEFDRRLAETEARIRAGRCAWFEQEESCIPFPEVKMKVTYRTASGRMEFQIEAAGGPKIIGIIASIQDIFEEPCCGCCKSKEIKLNARKTDKGTYYEWVCNACTAKIQIHQKKEESGGGLYIVRGAKNPETDRWEKLPDNGWSVYKPKGESSKRDSDERREEPSKQRQEDDGDIPF